ncbi:hypothetical protein FSP39_023459 [Pinctada imbricata]|uniref:Uncharacterized protein n=1 Tax=Pinctada imbricata TaxID=66713 RepID=A0AA88XNN4_PINIB|nr:hypothetical protein FSP39_023459 [Pinctada imbricata]
MKLRQLISTNPFQKSRDKKKKKSEAQQHHDKKDKSTRIDSVSDISSAAYSSDISSAVYTSDISGAVYSGGSITCTPTFERPPFRLGTNSAFVANRYNISIEDYRTSYTFDNDIEDGSPAVPRRRNKIKTNPWIKHSVELQNTEAVLHGLDIPESADPSDLGLCRQRLKEIQQITDFNTQNLESLNTLDSVELRSRKDRTNTEISYRWSIISEGDISIDLDPSTIDSLSEQFKSLQYNCSFEYEDKLDLVLEDGFRRDHIYVSVQDLLSDSSELTDSKEDDFMSQYNNEMDQKKPSAMEESIDAGYSSLTRDRRSSSESESSSTYCSEYSSFGTENESLDTRLDDSPLESDAISTGRTLPEVRLSLQEKIDQLRLEKFLVQEKIKEAREEERIRQEERKKFKSQLMSQRKSALFKTLNDLKERLENQSVRLQRSYSTVLTMQRRFARRRATFHCTVST